MNTHSHDYPNEPGHRGVDTSIEAAAAIAPAAKHLRAKVLRAVTDAGSTGLTVLELCQRDDLDRMGVQPRFSELRAENKIGDSGMRRKNPSGVSAIVWVAPEHLAYFDQQLGGANG